MEVGDNFTLDVFAMRHLAFLTMGLSFGEEKSDGGVEEMAREATCVGVSSLSLSSSSVGYYF